MAKKDFDKYNLTFGEHLEVMRKMILRIIIVAILLGVLVFYFKEEVFKIILAPKDNDFFTFRIIEKGLKAVGADIHFNNFEIQLISTELSSQFMTHITVSCTLSLLLASPYILFELFRFIMPALYVHEKNTQAVLQ